jgi:hypothetical protein
LMGCWLLDGGKANCYSTRLAQGSWAREIAQDGGLEQDLEEWFGLLQIKSQRQT